MAEYLVSYYQLSAVEHGRVPRQFAKIEANDPADAEEKLFPGGAQVHGMKIRSIYKTPKPHLDAQGNPIPRLEPKQHYYLYVSAAARKKWYAKHNPRTCNQEGCSNPVARYKRTCEQCQNKPQEPQTKGCEGGCTTQILAGRRRYCDACSARIERQFRQESRRRYRLKKGLIRLEGQFEKAKQLLAEATLDKCGYADKYTALNFPTCNSNRPCRSCLRLWVEVQRYRYEQLSAELDASSNPPGETVACA